MAETKHSSPPWAFKPVGEAYHVTQQGHGAWFMEVSMGYPSHEMAYPLDAIAEFESGIHFMQTAINSHASQASRIAELESAIDDFRPLAQVAFLWLTSGARPGEVERYRDGYQRLLSTRAATGEAP